MRMLFNIHATMLSFTIFLAETIGSHLEKTGSPIIIQMANHSNSNNY